MAVTIKEPTIISVIAQGGDCKSSECLRYQAFPYKLRQLDNFFGASDNKFLQFGLGAGIDFNYFEVATAYTFDSAALHVDQSRMTNAYGLGLIGDFTIHPIIKEYISVGFPISLAVGTTPLLFSGERYLYVKQDYGLNFAFGFRKVNSVKGVIKYNICSQWYDYVKELNNDDGSKEKYVGRGTFNYMNLCAGVRVARYGREDESVGHVFDIYYIMSKDFPNSPTQFNHWNMGIGMSYWVMSTIKAKVEYITRTPQAWFKFTPNTFEGSLILVSIMYNYNWFY